jgi:hypothetical protein
MAGRRTFFDTVREFFKGRRRSKGDVYVEPSDEVRWESAGPGSISDNRLGAHFKGLLADREVVSAGRVQILNLNKIRDRLGEHWPRYAEKIHAVVHETFEHRLVRADVYSRLSEFAYVIVFATLSKAEAQIKCSAIAEEIAAKLFGQEEAAKLVEVQTVVIGVGRGVALEKVNVAEVLSDLFDKHAALEGTLSSKEAAALAAVEAVDARLLEWMKSPFNPVVTELPADLDYRFRLVWDVARNALSTFLCVIVRKTDDPNVSLDYSSLYHADSAELIAKLDYSVLARVKRELKALHESKRRVLIGCPVHFQTLNRLSSRAYFTTLLKDVPEGFGQYLMFEIVGLPDATPQSRVAEIAATLRPYARSILVRQERGAVRFGHIAGTGVHAVGIDAGQYGAPEDRLMPAMNDFAVAAKDAALKSYIHGLSSLSLTTAALGAGFDYIHSHAVHAPLEQPDYIRRFEFMDLYAKLRAGHG